ncbi:MAG: hypothetical protein CMN74_02205 [Sphingorhabdus sp.]|nr:hypothetical protein [Sphingorhabdus sp.]
MQDIRSITDLGRTPHADADALVETWLMMGWGRYAKHQSTDIDTALSIIDELITEQVKNTSSQQPFNNSMLVALPAHPDVSPKQNQIEVASRSVTVRPLKDEPTLEEITTTSIGVRGTFARNMLYGHRLSVANSRLPAAMASQYMQRVTSWTRDQQNPLRLSDLLDIGYPLPPLVINRITRGKANTLFHIAMPTSPWSEMRARVKQALGQDQ